MVSTVAIAGGTGALGRGLALRLAAGGVPVALGSRDARRGAVAAEEVAAQLGPDAAAVVGGGNAEMAAADLVILAVPFESLEGTLEVLGPVVEGRIVVSAVNPLGFDADGPHALDVGPGCVAERVAAGLPGARVAGAFHTVSSHQLGLLDEPMDDDVLVVGDDPEVVDVVVALANRIEGCRGVAVGPLRLAATLEVITPVLIAVNKRYRAHAGVRLSGLPADAG